MNLESFYPTSPKTIAKLINDDSISYYKDKLILDACAGTGNLADYIVDKIQYNKAKPYSFVKGTISGNIFTAEHDEFYQSSEGKIFYLICGETVVRSYVAKYIDYKTIVLSQFFPDGFYEGFKGDDVSTFNIHTIEIEPNFQFALKGKGYKLVHNDWLNFDTYTSYDLIIANFPFSIGDKCLDKALQLIERNGGSLHCIVNAETIKNLCTALRQSIYDKLISHNAVIEFYEDEFVDSDRPTSVEIAIIKVSVAAEHKKSFLLDNYEKSEKQYFAEEFQPQELVSGNYIEEAVASYKKECELGVKLIKEWEALKPYIRQEISRPEDDSKASPILELKVAHARYSSRSTDDLINSYLEEVRNKYWSILIREPRFTANFTSNIVSELDRRLTELRQYDFSIFNIHQLNEDLIKQVNSGIENAILKMFDEFSNKYHWRDDPDVTNTYLYDGWKTNKSWKINKKIILPMNGISANYNGSYSWDYYIKEKMRDIVQVMYYLSEDKKDIKSTLINQMYWAEQTQSFNLDLHWIKVKFYKKRTAHITFLDEKLLEKFNIFGSQKKGWLPPSHGKAKYEDMSIEEQEIITNFYGTAEKYHEILDKKDYYLSGVNLLQLTDGNSEN